MIDIEDTKLSKWGVLFFGFYFVAMPLVVIFSNYGFPRTEVLVTAILATLSGAVAYYLIRKQNGSTNLSVAIGIVMVIFGSYIGIIFFSLTTNNPFEEYRTIFGGLAVWAIPTIMWQETKWMLKRRNELASLSEAAAESAGFIVALIYVMIAISLNQLTKGDGSPLLLGLLFMWLLYRLILGIFGNS